MQRVVAVAVRYLQQPGIAANEKRGDITAVVDHCAQQRREHVLGHCAQFDLSAFNQVLDDWHVALSTSVVERAAPAAAAVLRRQVFDFRVRLALDEELGAVCCALRHAYGRENEGSVAFIIDAIHV